jgi:hypothetical protein
VFGLLTAAGDLGWIFDKNTINKTSILKSSVAAPQSTLTAFEATAFAHDVERLNEMSPTASASAHEVERLNEMDAFHGTS